MHPDLESLLRLQEADDAVTRAEETLAALVPEETVLDAELQAAERAWRAAVEAIAGAARQRETLESRIEQYRLMQERRRQRLEFVRGAKEASTLMAELDLARSVMAREEAEWIRSSDSVADAERKAAEAERALQEARAQQAPRRGDLEARRAELEQRLGESRRSREAFAGGVKPAMLARYDRIRAGRAPRALFSLHADACGNCFTAIPLHRRVQIERGLSLESCEVCGVLLYAER